MKLGLIVPFQKSVKTEFEKCLALGFPTCQLVAWDHTLLTPEMAEITINAIKETNIDVTTLWTGWPGPVVWDFIEGPSTLGLVPTAYQWARLEVLKKASDFAKTVGIKSITTHVGFIPENLLDPLYKQTVIAIRIIGEHCKNNGQEFWFETGQETPTTLLRTIEDVNLDNLGINLDPANLLMYGKGNPLDALDIFGKYVRGVHAKDGEYPTCGRKLGAEKPLGKGRVNYPLFLKKLKEIGYNGALTVEREISGEQQIIDIKKAREYLLTLLNQI